MGRDGELRQLGAVMARASEGRGRVVLISGDAGIGKTRLGMELVRSCRQRGEHVLLGRAVPEESDLPFAALADALRAARRSAPAVWEAARSRAEILWAVASELAAQEGAAGRPADRPVVFEALLDAVEEAAGDRTALWVLDDLHWADEATWEFVRYAVRRVADMGVVLAVTYRTEEMGRGHPWWRDLVRLRREPAVTSLPLSGLAPADSERLVHAIDPDLPPDTVAEIVQRGAGTPLLLEELASLASARGDLVSVPDVARADVSERAARLTPQAKALLEAAAVVGLETDAALLTSLCPAEDPAVLVSAGLLDRQDSGFRFRHPLFQEAVYEDIPAERRRALHEEIAAAIAKTDDHCAERIAAHMERADRTEAALSVLQTAAMEANRAGQAGREATIHLAALHLAQRHRSLASRRAGLERQAIMGLYYAGRWTELGPLLRSARARHHQFSLAERAQFAAVSCKHLFWTGSCDQALALARDELAGLERAGARNVAGPLLLEAALVAWFAGDGSAARSFADGALDTARQAGEVESEIWARFAEICIAYGEHGDPQIAITHLDEDIAAARARGLAMAEDSARLLLSLLNNAPQGAGEGRLVPGQADCLWWLAIMYEGAFLLMEGDYEHSEAIFGQIRQGCQLRGASMEAWVSAKEACLYLHRGDLEAARTLLGPHGETSQAISCGLIGAEQSVAHGWLAWEENNFSEAAARLASACSDHLLSTYNAICPGLAFLALRVDALMRLGRSGEAAGAISAAGSLNLSHARFGAAALAAARFRHQPTPERALAAEAAVTTAPWPWLAALVGCWRGEFLHDAQAARAARGQFEAIGADLGVRRTEAVLRRLGVTPPRRDRGSGVLSPREAEIAGLIAEGLTNPAIARRLFLSRPTVASHVAHILAKLGFSSRSQIAAWAAQHDTVTR